MWSAVLIDDDAGQGVGEVANPYSRQISFRHNRPVTVHFGVRLDDEQADALLETDLLVKLYNDELGILPQFVGEITAAEEVVTATSKRIGITAADPWGARLPQRLIGKSVDGFKKTVATDRGQAIKEMIDTANAEQPPYSDTGIRVGTVQASSSDLMGPWQYKPLSEAAGELVAALDGPDWRLDFTEPTPDALGLALATANFYPFVGVQRTEAKFAYSNDEDDRGNVKGYHRQITKQGMLNTGYSLPPGFPAATAGDVQTWFDGPARAKWNWREGVVPSDLVVDTLRLKLLQEHVAIRKIPRQVITIDGLLPASDDEHAPAVPRFGIDYEVGDFVPFRAVVDGETRVDAFFRVYGVDLEIGDEGQETPTLHLVPDE